MDKYYHLSTVMLIVLLTACGGGGGSDSAQEPTDSIPPTGLVATPGDAIIHVQWDPVGEADSYNLYYATESFAGLTDLENYASLAGGTLMPNQTSPVILTGVLNGTQYYLVVTAVNIAGESIASIEAITTPLPQTTTSISQINDTGITWGGNYPVGNNTTCLGETIEQQDCSHGRDAHPATNSDSDGHAGFSYTKIDANGNELPVNATTWSCIRDNVTGLVWEKKEGGNGRYGDEGLHDADDTYNWYNTDPNTNGGSNGYANDDGGTCYGYVNNLAPITTYCNTQAYVARVNTAGLCGATNWRMPRKTELVGLLNLNGTNHTTDLSYFPNSRSSFYWASAYARIPGAAWIVGFDYGFSDGYYRHNGSFPVRLVRSVE